jgi:hypothetical protein
VVTGISVGSLNALGLGLYAKGQESQFVDYMSNFWTHLDSDDIYKGWLLGEAEGFFDASGLYNSEPSKDTISKILADFPKGFQRNLIIGTTDLASGDFVVFESGETKESWVDITMAGMATGGVFPVVNIGDYELVDGYIKYTIDLIDAVTKCQALGYDDSDIIVDAVMCTAKTISTIDSSKLLTLESLVRYLEIVSYQGVMGAIKNAAHDFKTVDFRYTIYPHQTLPDANLDPHPYTFSSSQAQKMLDIGEASAKAAVKDSVAQLLQE